MKTCFFLLLLSQLFAFSLPDATSVHNTGADCLSLTDAEKIIGQTVALTEHGYEERNKVKRHTCTYTATAPDAATNKTGHLYYLLEEHADGVAAQKVFDDVIADNRGMGGQEQLPHLGDQALFHTDDKNFCLLMARKGSKIIRFKVNRMTSKTSVPALKEVVKNTLLTL